MAISIDLSGKIAAVTGGSGGIGAATVALLREAGAECLVLDIPKPGTLAKDVYRVTDVTNERLVDQVFADIVAEFGGIDILVNCAGITINAYALKMTIEQWGKVIAVNQTGTFLCMRAAGRAMKAQGAERGGCIINLSSIGREGNPGQIGYVASKGAVSAMTTAAGEELAGFGIRVNAIAPGPVDTEMLATVPEELKLAMVANAAIKKLATPQDIANAILFLASPLASHITGETITVSGGLHMP